MEATYFVNSLLISRSVFIFRMRMAALTTHMCILRKCARGVFLCDLEKRIACVSSVGVVLLMVKSTVKLHFVIKKKGSFILYSFSLSFCSFPCMLLVNVLRKALGFFSYPHSLLFHSLFITFIMLCYSVLQHVLSLQVRH